VGERAEMVSAQCHAAQSFNPRDPERGSNVSFWTTQKIRSGSRATAIRRAKRLSGQFAMQGSKLLQKLVPGIEANHTRIPSDEYSRSQHTQALTDGLVTSFLGRLARG